MTTTSDFNRTESGPTTDKGAAHQIVDSAKEQAAEVGKEARYQTRQLADDARERARTRADDQVHRVAATLGEISGELRSMADTSAESDGHLAGAARDSAMLVDDLAGRLRDGGLDAAVADVRRFARQRPWMFLAGAFAVGAGLGRLTRNVDTASIAEAVRSEPGVAGGGNGTNRGDGEHASTDYSDPQRARAGSAQPSSGGRTGTVASGSTSGRPLGNRADVSGALPGEGNPE